ncbi:MAG: hypothetical protein WBV94_23505 [Blastocatellia bacterium]
MPCAIEFRPFRADSYVEFTYYHGLFSWAGRTGPDLSATGWLATCLAFCYGAGKAVTPRSRIIGVCGAAVAALLIVMKVIPAIPGSFRRFEYIALVAWIILGFGLWKRRTVKG